MEKQLQKISQPQALGIWQQQWPQLLQSVKLTSGSTLQEVYKTNTTPSIQAISGGDEEMGIAIFSTIISAITGFLAPGEWSPEAITVNASEWYNDYSELTIAEMKLFVARAKSGSFGTIYGKLTPAVMIDWISKWYSKCMAERELYNASLKPEFTEPENPVPENLVKDAIKQAEQMIAATRERDRYHVNPEIAARIDTVEKIKKAYKKNPDAVAAKINQIFIDEGGWYAPTYDLLIRALPIDFVSEHYNNLEK